MIFFVLAAIFGIWKKCGKNYWIAILLGIILQISANFLFHAGGTLDDPSGDGIISGPFRRLTNDGPSFLLIMLPAIGLGWGLPIYLITRAYRLGKK